VSVELAAFLGSMMRHPTEDRQTSVFCMKCQNAMTALTTICFRAPNGPLRLYGPALGPLFPLPLLPLAGPETDVHAPLASEPPRGVPYLSPSISVTPPLI